ncbi:MAG: DUF362 domain-containing protein [bacterium]|nr:MAG: DUF362 domain-containing protein [bacterium]
MQKPTVYYTSLREDTDSPYGKISKLITKVNLKKWIKNDEIIAIKTHIGEEGNVRYIRPTYIRKIADTAKKYGGKPFVTDTTSLYPGPRFNAIDNINTAARNGFTSETMNAPVIIADGLKGEAGVAVAVKGKYLSKVSVAAVLTDIDKMIVVSHFKLHEFAGFGGAIKNLGMGCVTKTTKAACHKVNRPFHVPENCKACKTCIENCEYDCISLKNKRIVFNRTTCKGCLACYFSCPHDAFKLPKNITENLQKALVESALGVTKLVKPENIIYMNLLIDIVEFCDCAPMSGVPIIPDIGYLLSTDPVAVDKTCIDLIEKHIPKDQKNSHCCVDRDCWDLEKQNAHIVYAEKMGLGKGTYKLKRI